MIRNVIYCGDPVALGVIMKRVRAHAPALAVDARKFEGDIEHAAVNVVYMKDNGTADAARLAAVVKAYEANGQKVSVYAIADLDKMLADVVPKSAIPVPKLAFHVKEDADKLKAAKLKAAEERAATAPPSTSKPPDAVKAAAK